MELIIKISNEMFDTFKKHGIMAFDNLGEYDRDMVADAIANGTPYNSSGDAISRSWVKHNVLPLMDTETRIYAEAKLDDAPAVEVRPKGEWVMTYKGTAGINAYMCSICGHTIFCSEKGLSHYKGCYCGADMRGDSLRNATRKSGIWQFVSDDKTSLEQTYRCSECGRMVTVYNKSCLKRYPFCYCGADMKTEDK